MGLTQVTNPSEYETRPYVVNVVPFSYDTLSRADFAGVRAIEMGCSVRKRRTKVVASASKLAIKTLTARVTSLVHLVESLIHKSDNRAVAATNVRNASFQ